MSNTHDGPLVSLQTYRDEIEAQMAAWSARPDDPMFAEVMGRAAGVLVGIDGCIERLKAAQDAAPAAVPVWALLSYPDAATATGDAVNDPPTRYDCGSFAMDRDDLPFGGWLCQGERVEVCRIVNVPVGSSIHNCAKGVS